VKILITGGRGFLGQPLATALAAVGNEVVALDNDSRASGGTAAKVEQLTADIRDADAVRDACRGCDLVVHLAAVQGTGNFYAMPDHVLDVNLRGVLNVAEACAAERVERLVFASSSEVYGVPESFPTPETAPMCVPDARNPRWSYGGSKLIGELVVVNWARERGFDYTVLRYHNVYGPAMGWDHVIPQFIRRLELGEDFTVQGDGEQRRAFCFVEDAVNGTIAACGDGGANEILNLGNPDEEHSVNDLVASLTRVSGKQIEPQHVAFEGEGTRRRVPDISRARQLIGFEPSVTLDDGLRRTYDWYVEALRTEESERDDGR